MANSKYEYVKLYEQPDTLLPNTWLIVRIDGRGFHNFSNRYGFKKPNDRRNLDLMNSAAEAVMTDIPDIIIGYGVSDEYSKNLASFFTDLVDYSIEDQVSTVVSTFTAYYVHLWSTYFVDITLSPPLPSFDGRVIQYPSIQNLRDYLSWRQVDLEGHINNLYNTTFWSLIQLGGLSPKSAEKELTGTLSADKHEILFSHYKINYNNEPEIYRKGTVIWHDYELDKTVSASSNTNESLTQTKDLGLSQIEGEKRIKRKIKVRLTVQHLDLIGDEFWVKRPWLLADGPLKKPMRHDAK